MKWILIGAILFLSSLHAAPQKIASSPPPANEYYDPDLFRKNCPVYSAHVEFLYWSIAEGSLDYALKMRRPAWGSTPSFAQGKFETASYDLDPGFRIALQYFRAPHYWEMKWQYTRMTNRGHSSAEKPGPSQEFLTGTWPQITSDPLNTATSRLHFNYNVFDWAVDRIFFPNPHLRLRVIGGVATAWMDQYWKVRYVDTAQHSTEIQNRWRFTGAGLKMGTMIDWYWTGDLYVTGLGSFGALIGNYSNRAKQTTNFQPTPSDNPAIPVRDASYCDVRPTATIQMLLGPSWQKNLSHTRVEVFAGFETNLWFNLQEIYRSTSSTPSAAKETWINNSLLALYGLTTRLSLDF